MSPQRRGLLVSAPSSGAGKTTVTLGLLRAFKDRGENVASAKTGPDYIDPAFHAAATARPCVTLDPWCASSEQIRARAGQSEGDLLVVEGAMGLFDAAPSLDNPMGHGSSADVAAALGLPVLLVIDAARRSQTAAAVVHGLVGFRDGIKIGGVILNRIGSPRHEAMMRRAVETVVPVVGAIPRNADLAVPSRHLGLKQAIEISDLNGLLTELSETISTHCDLDTIQAMATPPFQGGAPVRMPPLGQRIAVAEDEAFGFSYPHMLSDWRDAGAEIVPFSPLADEGPDAHCDAVFLPGGYPELYGGRLASAQGFKAAMIRAANRNALIYGECGGFMVLGRGLIDGYGRRHEMLGFLNLETSFAERKLSLGYRDLTPLGATPWQRPLKGHEFHYSTIKHSEGEPLFSVRAAAVQEDTLIGLREGSIMGSYAHIVEQCTEV